MIVFGLNLPVMEAIVILHVVTIWYLYRVLKQLK
jgi:uncharacterized membrane protein